MSAMPLWIIQKGWWWLFACRNLAQDFCIGFEERIHGLDELASHSTDNAYLSRTLARAWINGTFGLNQPDVSLGPLCVTAHQPGDNQLLHLFHHASASARLPGRM